MKTRLFVFFTFCMACLLTGCHPPVSGPEARKTSIVPPADDFSLFSLAAEKVDGSGDFLLAGLAGEPVLAYYYAPWAESSRDVAAHLDALLPSGISILPLMVDRQGGADAGVALPSAKTLLPAVKAGEELLRLAGGIRALPSVVLFDAEGKAVKVWPGHVAPSNTLAEIAAVLK
jgi:hypothetical protein